MRKLPLYGIILSLVLIIPFASGQMFEKATLQETATIFYDQKFSNSIIVSIGFETTDNNEIKISDKIIEKINSNEKIRSIVFTNAGECVIGVTTEEQCIMINYDYQQLKGDGGIRMVQDSARDMSNELIDELNETFGTDTKFHSTFIHAADDANILLETSGAVSGRGTVSATYIMQKQATDFLFADLAGRLVSTDIKESKGFYDITKKMAENDSSIISVSILRNGNSNLFMFKVATEIKNDDLDISKINVLDMLSINEISRSEIFNERNVPLNTVINLIVIPNEPSQINAVATHLITDVTSLENISKKGWFFTSPAGNKIDGKFLFGQDKIATSNEVKIEISPWDGQSEIIIYTVENIPKQEEKEYEFFEEKESDNNNQYILLGIIIAVGIGTALFYLKGYKPKH